MRIGSVAVGLILMSFVYSSSSQSLVWTKVESADAGFEALFPCKPEILKKLFQKVPKEAYSYSYKCQAAGINFSISLPERFHDYDSGKVDEELEGLEQSLKSIIGSGADITTSHQLFSGYASREFRVDKGKTLGIILIIAHPRGVYGVQALGDYERQEDKAKTQEMIAKFIHSLKLIQSS